MADLTPDDFDRHLQRHAQSMADLTKEVQAALASGNQSQVNAAIAKYQTTLKVQERLNKLSNRLSDAAQPVGNAISAPTFPRLAVPDIDTDFPGTRADKVAIPQPQPTPSLRVTYSTPHPTVQRFGRGRGSRPKYPRISHKAHKGLYLEASEYVVPLWTIIARFNRPFRLEEVREAIRKEVFLRAHDLELVQPKVNNGKKAKPRWEHMLSGAFSHSVSTNRRLFKEGKAPLVRYIDSVGKHGREVMYQVNPLGLAEMHRVLSARNLPTPA